MPWRSLLLKVRSQVMIVPWVLDGSIGKCTSSGRTSASIALVQHWWGTTALLNGIQVNSTLLNGQTPHLSSAQIDKLNLSSIVTSASALSWKCCSFYGTCVEAVKWADFCLICIWGMRHQICCTLSFEGKFEALFCPFAGTKSATGIGRKRRYWCMLLWGPRCANLGKGTNNMLKVDPHQIVMVPFP